MIPKVLGTGGYVGLVVSTVGAWSLGCTGFQVEGILSQASGFSEWGSG